MTVEASELFRHFDDGLEKILSIAEEPHVQDVRRSRKQTPPYMRELIILLSNEYSGGRNEGEFG